MDICKMLMSLEMLTVRVNGVTVNLTDVTSIARFEGKASETIIHLSRVNPPSNDTIREKEMEGSQCLMSFRSWSL